MTGGLPRGLISIEDNPRLAQEQGEAHDPPRLDVTAIAKTWRIYCASSNVLEADTGNRLQNLFWRTWSNPDLLRNLHPITFTNVVHLIGTGRGRVHFPRRSNIGTDPDAHYDDDSTPVPSGPPTATASPVQASSTPANPSALISRTREDSNTFIKPPQSILKKPSTDHGYVEPGATEAPRLLLHESKRDSTGSSSSTAEALSPTSSERPRMRRQTSGNSKKTSFVANTSGRSKGRPALPRKKSSQATVPQAKDRQKEPARSPVRSPVKSPLKSFSGYEVVAQASIINRAQAMGPPGLPVPPGLSGAKSAAFLLPSASSWQSDESTSPGRRNSVTQNSMPLVDPNFRQHFVEARSTSHINLASAASKMRKTGSVVRFAEDLPVELGKSKAKEPSASVPGTSALRRTSGAEARRSSLSTTETAAIEDSDEDESDGDDDDDTLVMLPRTRSQLSMAIEQRRRVSGSQNLGPSEGVVEAQPNASKGKGKGKGKGKNTGNEDTEDELLKMGRKNGVTKAGGRRSRLPLGTSTSSGQRYRSPSPPPIF